MDGWGEAVGWATHHSLSQSETVRVREAAADRARCSRPRSRMRMRRPAVSTTLLHVRRWKPRSLSPVHPGSADTSPSPSPKVPGPRFSDPAPASRRGVCAPAPRPCSQSGRPRSRRPARRQSVIVRDRVFLHAIHSLQMQTPPPPWLEPAPPGVALLISGRMRCVCRRAGSSAGAESRGLGSDGGGHCSSSSLLLVDVEHRLRGHRSPPPAKKVAVRAKGTCVSATPHRPWTHSPLRTTHSFPSKVVVMQRGRLSRKD